MDDSRTTKSHDSNQKVGVYDSKKGRTGMSTTTIVAAIIAAIIILLLIWWLMTGDTPTT
jgi:heme/copper-type cytochrome/quinol oxidase subunit 4